MLVKLKLALNLKSSENWSLYEIKNSTPEFSTVPALIAGALEPIPATPVKAEDCGCINKSSVVFL